MIFTKTYTRIAMPHFDYCPECGQRVADWFFEWYLPEEQKQIVTGKANMDCPLCLDPVGFVKGKLSEPVEGVPTLQRSTEGAERWAKRNEYESLDDFLKNPDEKARAEPFIDHYWNEDEEGWKAKDYQYQPSEDNQDRELVH